MVELQIVFIIITILLVIIALFYKNTNTKFKNIVQKYKLYYVYNILFYLICLLAITFYKLKIDAILLSLIILYFVYLSLDLISGQSEKENEIYTLIIMFILIIFILIISIKYIIIVEIIRR